MSNTTEYTETSTYLDDALFAQVTSRLTRLDMPPGTWFRWLIERELKKPRKLPHATDRPAGCSDHRIQAQVTPDESKKIHTLAEKNGVKIAEWGRRIIERELLRPVREVLQDETLPIPRGRQRDLEALVDRVYEWAEGRGVNTVTAREAMRQFNLRKETVLAVFEKWEKDNRGAIKKAAPQSDSAKPLPNALRRVIFQLRAPERVAG